jgi:hypothetical protein
MAGSTVCDIGIKYPVLPLMGRIIFMRYDFLLQTDGHWILTVSCVYYNY